MNQLTATIAAWMTLATAFCDAAPVAQSIAPNMSFEQGEDDAPADWKFYSWKDASGWWDAEHAYRGEKSLGMGGLNGGWSANVPVEGGKVHRIQMHYRIAEGPSQIVLYVRVPTGPREMKTVLYKPLHHIEAAREAGCRINVYNNAVNFPEHRPIRVRLWPWLLRKYRVDGTLSWWGTVCWRDRLEDPWTAGEGGSGVMLYPPVVCHCLLVDSAF